MEPAITPATAGGAFEVPSSPRVISCIAGIMIVTAKIRLMSFAASDDHAQVFFGGGPASSDQVVVHDGVPAATAPNGKRFTAPP